MSEALHLPAFAERYVNLANPRLGARVVTVTDEFFAPCERMLNPAEPVFVPGKFDDNGKWMDGWESRRKRDPGHDWCELRIAGPARIHGVDIDTRHFIGNHPPGASIEACCCTEGDPDDHSKWQEILPRVELAANSRHLHAIADSGVWTHLRLHIYPDGGVARLKVFGQIQCDPQRLQSELVDLLAVENGGRALACSHQGFGSSMHNLNLPGRGVNMGDGWETPRRRGPGHDWAILKLGTTALLEKLELDTAYYRGNFPDSASVEACCLPADATDESLQEYAEWQPLLQQQKLQADAVHRYDKLAMAGPVTHLRVNIYPDGGLSRVRAWGRAVS